MIKIGFCGTDCYDIIQYLARFLLLSGKKVLMTDLSNNRSLEWSIPSINDYSGVVDVNGIDYVNAAKEGVMREYDICFIYFGQPQEKVTCHILYYVTDFQLHNIHYVSQEKKRNKSENITQYLIVRDISQEKKFRYIMGECEFEKECSFYIQQDEQDRIYQLGEQYHDRRNGIRKVSNEMKELVERSYFDILHHCTNQLIEEREVQLKKIWKQLKKGA